jgi:hypothetical protein
MSPNGTSRKSRLLSVWSAFGPKSDSVTRLMSHARQVGSSNRGLVHCNVSRRQRFAPSLATHEPPSTFVSSGSSTRSKFSALIGPTSL